MLILNACILSETLSYIITITKCDHNSGIPKTTLQLYNCFLSVLIDIQCLLKGDNRFYPAISIALGTLNVFKVQKDTLFAFQQNILSNLAKNYLASMMLYSKFAPQSSFVFTEQR